MSKLPQATTEPRVMVCRFYDTASRLIGTLTTDATDPEIAIQQLLSRDDQWVTVETIPQTARKVQINKVAYIDAIPQAVIDAKSTQEISRGTGYDHA